MSSGARSYADERAQNTAGGGSASAGNSGAGRGEMSGTNVKKETVWLVE